MCEGSIKERLAAEMCWVVLMLMLMLLLLLLLLLLFLFLLLRRRGEVSRERRGAPPIPSVPGGRAGGRSVIRSESVNSAVSSRSRGALIGCLEGDGDWDCGTNH